MAPQSPLAWRPPWSHLSFYWRQWQCLIDSYAFLLALQQSSSLAVTMFDKLSSFQVPIATIGHNSRWSGYLGDTAREAENLNEPMQYYKNNLPPQVGSTLNFNSGSKCAREDLLTVSNAYIWWTVWLDEKPPLWAFDELLFWWIAASMKSHLTLLWVSKKVLWYK